MPRKGGQAVGAAVGGAKAATAADNDDDGQAGRDDGDTDGAAGADDQAGRRREGSQPDRRVARERRAPRPVMSQAHPSEGPSRGLVAAVIVGGGALLGAILGRLSGDDDRGGAASG